MNNKKDTNLNYVPKGEELEKIKKTIREKAEKQAIGETEATEEQIKTFEEIVKEANMPVELTDDKFTLGPKELDIRKLSDENYRQMMFRIGTLGIVYQRQMTQSVLDLTRMLMLLIVKQGKEVKAEDLLNEIDNLMDKISKKLNIEKLANKKN